MRSAAPPASPAPSSSSSSSWARSASAARASANADVDDDPGEGSGGCAISIGSRPWAHVWIDGRDTGVSTPVRDYKVPCGRHKLELKRPDQDIDQMEVITLQRGRPFKRTFNLE